MMLNIFVCDHQTKIDFFFCLAKLICKVIGTEDYKVLSCSDHLGTGFIIEKTQLLPLDIFRFKPLNLLNLKFHNFTIPTYCLAI